MATSKGAAGNDGDKGTPVTPLSMGNGGSKALVFGTVQSAEGQALATTTAAREGVTLAEATVRAIAAGYPLTRDGFAAAELRWAVTHAGTPRGTRRGTTHVCAHNGTAGKVERCSGGHAAKGDTCKYEFVSVGDSVRRWRNDDGHDAPAHDGDAPALVKAARKVLAGQLREVAARGHTVADMLATRSIARYVALGIADAAMLGRAVKAASKGDDA